MLQFDHEGGVQYVNPFPHPLSELMLSYLPSPCPLPILNCTHKKDGGHLNAYMVKNNKYDLPLLVIHLLVYAVTVHTMYM